MADIPKLTKWKRLFVLSGPPSPANILVGSSPSLLKGKVQKYKEILQEHFLVVAILTNPPHPSYLGKEIFGIDKPESDFFDFVSIESS